MYGRTKTKSQLRSLLFITKEAKNSTLYKLNKHCGQLRDMCKPLEILPSTCAKNNALSSVHSDNVELFIEHPYHVLTVYG